MHIDNKWLKARAVGTVIVGFVMNLTITAGCGAIATRHLLWQWLGNYGLLLGFIVGGLLGLSAWRRDPLMLTSRSKEENDDQWKAKVNELYQPVFLRSTLVLDVAAAWDEAASENEAFDLQRDTPVAAAPASARRL